MPLPISSLIVCKWSIILYYAGFTLADDSDLVPSARADWPACGERQAYFVEVSTDEGGGERQDYDTLYLFSVVGERG